MLATGEKNHFAQRGKKVRYVSYFVVSFKCLIGLGRTIGMFASNLPGF